MSLDLDTLGLSATVTAEGISAPDYQTVLDTITGYFQQIYGSDAYLDPDSKDGQLVALVALTIHDANNTAISVYRSFSPSTALADALTSIAAILGLVAAKYFGWLMIDALAAIASSLVIVKWSVGLLIEAGGVLLDFKVNGKAEMKE